MTARGSPGGVRPGRQSRRKGPRSLGAAPIRVLRRAAWLPIAVCMLLLTSHVARAGHLLLVAHERCAEHGELIHAEHAASPQRAADEASDGALAPTTAHQGQSASDSHEHCDALAIAHTPVSPGVAIDEVRLLDGYLLPWSLRPGVGERAVDVLFLAPKNSPPA